MVTSSSALARQITEDDISYKTHFYKQVYDIEEDGTYTLETAFDVEILKDSGRSPLSPYFLKYSHDSSELKVLEARAIAKNEAGADQVTEMDVDVINASDKPLADSGNRRSKDHQKTVAFPNLRVGTHIYIKYITKTIRPPYPGFFGAQFNFNSSIFGYYSKTLQRSLEIRSKKKLFFEFQDRNEYFRENHNLKDGYVTYAHYELKQPLLIGSVDEENNYIEKESYPTLTISSLQKGHWEEFSRINKAERDLVINQPLPHSFETPIQKGLLVPTTIDKINVVTSWLADHLTYLTDSSTREGRLIPRNFTEIAAHMQGDCKDYSALTVAILRRLGITAHYATVFSGTQYETPPIPHSLPHHFTNHAIVKVADGERTFWIDPTSKKSFAGRIFSNIEGKYVLVHDDHPHIEEIPRATPEDSITHTILTIQLSETAAEIHAQLKYINNAAISWTGLGLDRSKEQVEKSLLDQVATSSSTYEAKFEEFNLNSRIVNDQSFKFSFKKHEPLSDTSLGSSYTVPCISPNRLVKLENRTSALSLSSFPYIQIYETEIMKNGLVTPLPPSFSKNCEITSPWFDFQFTSRDQEDRFSVYQKKTVKSKLLTLKDLLSPEFEELQRKLSSCAKHYGVICTINGCIMKENSNNLD